MQEVGGAFAFAHLKRLAVFRAMVTAEGLVRL